MSPSPLGGLLDLGMGNGERILGFQIIPYFTQPKNLLPYLTPEMFLHYLTPGQNLLPNNMTL
jgi:hypothetical protein